VQSKVTIPQSLIITFSRKQFEYQRAVRNRQIERAKKLLDTAKDPEEVKRGPQDIRRFLKRKKTKAEENMTAQDLYEINQERILEEEKYDGYYDKSVKRGLLKTLKGPDFHHSLLGDRHFFKNSSSKPHF